MSYTIDYTVCKEGLFGSQDVYYDEDMVNEIIDSLDPNDFNSIKRFRYLVTIFQIDLDDFEEKYIPFNTARNLRVRINNKIREVLGDDIVNIYEYCVKTQRHELWQGDQLYQAFSFNIIDPNRDSTTPHRLDKPYYVAVCLKCAVKLYSYIDQDKVHSLKDIKDIHHVINGSYVDSYFYQCYGTKTELSSEELEDNAKASDAFMDMLLSNNFDCACKWVDVRTDLYNACFNSSEYKLALR